jgi:hypothetical protein
MTMILDGSAGVTFPNSTVQASAGQVLQVVNATYGTQVTSSSTTLVDTGLTATITPKFSTSKILVLVSQNGCDSSAGNADNGLTLSLYRNSTLINLFALALGYTNTTLRQIQSASTVYLDSPATTSAVTYKTQFGQWNTSVASVAVNANGVSSTITLMEIAA